MTQRTDNGVALIIGAGDFLGAAIARRFAREGFHTVVTRRRFQTVTAGVAANHWMTDDAWARFLVEVVHEENSLGRDARGRPAPIDNDTLRLRVQVAR